MIGPARLHSIELGFSPTLLAGGRPEKASCPISFEMGGLELGSTRGLQTLKEL